MNWYEDHHNLARLARHMGEQGDTLTQVAYMLEKPWAFEDDWLSLLNSAATRCQEFPDIVLHGMRCVMDVGRHTHLPTTPEVGQPDA